MKRVLVLASVASMIDQFNMPNIRLLQEMGYAVDVACNFKEGSTCSDERIHELRQNLKKMDVHCYQIDFARDITNIRRNVRAFWQVEYLLDKGRYVFIHCHSPIGGVVGRLTGKKTHTKVVYTAHGFHFYKGAPLKNWLVYYPVEKICSYMTDVLICINKEDYALAKKKMKAKKTEYVPGVGVDLDKFGGIKISKKQKRAELGIPDGKTWILAVGELSERKNHKNLIAAMKLVHNAYLTIVGQGELRDELDKLIRDVGIEDKVKLLGFRTDISELCEAADVFAFPSYQEGLSVALMEAMASGKPVVCSKIRGNTDLIDEGKGGYFFKPDKPDEIADAIKKVMGCNMREMGFYNREKMKHYDVSEVMKQSREIYDQAGVGGGIPPHGACKKDGTAQEHRGGKGCRSAPVCRGVKRKQEPFCGD